MEAEDKYHEALEIDASSPRALYSIGICYERSEQWETAESYFRKALENDPAYITRYEMAAFYNHRPLPADIHHALARVLQQQKKDEEARLHYHLTKRIDATSELDPMFLQIMSEEDLDYHPMEKGKDPLERIDEWIPAKKMAYLFNLKDYKVLKETIQDLKLDDLYPFTKSLIVEALHAGAFIHSAHALILYRMFDGKNLEGTFNVLNESSFLPLLETAEAVYKDEMTLKEAISESKRLPFDITDALDVFFIVDQFIGIKPSIGLLVAQLWNSFLEKSPKKIDTAHGHFIQGKAYYRMRNLRKAAESYEKASQLFERSGDLESQGVSLSRLSEIYMGLGNLDAALSTMQQTIRIAESQNDQVGMMRSRFNHARFRFLADQMEECFEECMELAPLFEVIDIEQEIRDNMIDLLTRAAAAVGKDIPNEILTIVKGPAGDSYIPLHRLKSLSLESETPEDLERAIQLINEKLDQLKSKGTLSARVDLLHERGIILERLNRYEEARNDFLEALRIAEPLAAEIELWTILMNISQMYVRLNNTNEAIHYAERALHEAQIKNSWDNEKMSLQQLSFLLLEKDPERAVELYGLYMEGRK